MAFGCELVHIWTSANGRCFAENARAMDEVYAVMQRLAVFRPNLDSGPFQKQWLAQQMQAVLGRLENVAQYHKLKSRRDDYFEGLMWTLNGLCRLNYDVIHPHIDRLVFFC